MLESDNTVTSSTTTTPQMEQRVKNEDDSKIDESTEKQASRISPEIDVTREDRESSAEEIDVECSAGEEEAMEGVQESDEDQLKASESRKNSTSESVTSEKHEEASHLLLNFSNSRNAHEPLGAKSSGESTGSGSDQPAKPVPIKNFSTPETGNTLTNGSISQNHVSTIVATGLTGFVPSGQSAFQSPEALQHQQSVSSSGASTPLPSTPNGLTLFGPNSLPSTPTNSINGKTVHRKSSNAGTPEKPEQPTKTSFIRPPGLGPVAVPPPAAGQQAALVCPICGFSCPSKFHYNSHMNTHGDHQCTMCDYTSRTEGRLKKHMRESHTEEERQRAGINIEMTSSSKKKSSDNSSNSVNTANADTTQNQASVVNGTTASSVLQSVLQSPITTLASVLLNPPQLTSDTSSLSTTMASLVDAANAAAAASIAGSDAISGLQLDITGAQSLLGQLAGSQGGVPSALDQIRAFTENTALLPEGGMNLANALGVMTGVIGADHMDTLSNSSSTGGSGSGGSGSKSEKSSDKPAKKSESRRSSSSKVKQFKCKQCPHLSFSRDDCWAHARTHIPPEKQLNCRHCNFVTEYKHHLEYHYRNHNGSKPFQCVKCAYTCVNKSMLNSHMKSHTNIYQFRCMDCTYATKYCHSLKLHLKKYGHRRVPDGIEVANGNDGRRSKTPEGVVPLFNGFNANPATSLAQQLSLPIVTSPNMASYASQMLLQHHQMSEMKPFVLNGLPSLLNQPPAAPLMRCPTCDYEPKTAEDQIKHSMSHFFDRAASITNAQNGTGNGGHATNGNANGSEGNGNGNSTLSNLYSGLSQISSLMPHIQSMNKDTTVSVDMHEEERESGHAGDDEMEASSGATGSPACSSKGSADEESQKRKAFKLEQISQRLSQGRSPSSDETEDKDHDEHHMESSLSPAEPLSHSSGSVAVAPIVPVVTSSGLIEVSTPLNLFQQAANLYNVMQGRREGNENFRFHCMHCKMAFQDQALYHIHMGYHGYEQVFKCNRCGYQANNSLDFNVHLMQGSHD
ncbi:hypothetical protein WR25_22169 isoform A [Diploscapter pachys]|uniref:C2H2-type domain-containing protein n=1 Tax=Diploscapter pachys TaxID=2018661 RepID=A0A2A2KCD5_9BILA|nr:hypothetical protein WR25_22169 isoform A [Diploscapter pachys]